MNTSFSLRMADTFAQRLKTETSDGIHTQIKRAYLLAFAREPSEAELVLTSDFVKKNGLPAFCRVLFNLNEFIYLN
jgi:hypothetical protein